MVRNKPKRSNHHPSKLVLRFWRIVNSLIRFAPDQNLCSSGNRNWHDLQNGTLSFLWIDSFFWFKISTPVAQPMTTQTILTPYNTSKNWSGVSTRSEFENNTKQKSLTSTLSPPCNIYTLYLDAPSKIYNFNAIQSLTLFWLLWEN